MKRKPSGSYGYAGAVPPHGGTLINRMLHGELAEAARELAGRLPIVPLTPLNLSDFEMIAVGALSPLTGFMTETDYDAVVEDMHLANGLAWSMPVTLAAPDDLAATLKEGQTVALGEPGPDGTLRPIGLLDISEKFRADKKDEAEQVFRTTDPAHPGVARLFKQPDTLLAGEIWAFDLPTAATSEFPDLRLTPAELRSTFDDLGWRRIVAFQTRNPIHRAHEYIQKSALEIVDGLLLHPLVGETKSDDIPADVRIASYRVALEHYYPPERVRLAVFPAAMRYAGPREAIFHAICRKNYGATHFIVGRDHAGVGSYYGTYDAQLIFDAFEPDELGITPLFFEHSFYCRDCTQVVTAKTCPHGEASWIKLSGTQVRQMLERGEMLPTEFTRPEVGEVLMRGVQR